MGFFKKIGKAFKKVGKGLLKGISKLGPLGMLIPGGGGLLGKIGGMFGGGGGGGGYEDGGYGGYGGYEGGGYGGGGFGNTMQGIGGILDAMGINRESKAAQEFAQNALLQATDPKVTKYLTDLVAQNPDDSSYVKENIAADEASRKAAMEEGMKGIDAKFSGLGTLNSGPALMQNNKLNLALADEKARRDVGFKNDFRKMQSIANDKLYESTGRDFGFRADVAPDISRGAARGANFAGSMFGKIGKMFSGGRGGSRQLRRSPRQNYMMESERIY